MTLDATGAAVEPPADGPAVVPPSESLLREVMAMWWRRKHEDRRPVRPIGQGIGDGDTIMMFGQTRRWSEALDATQEPPVRWSDPNPPVPGTDSTRLVRGHVWGRGPTP